MFELYVSFKNNSFLQYLVEDIFKNLLKAGDEHPLQNIWKFRTHIIVECDLLNQLINESVANKEYKFKSERLARNGHCAFNVVIANLI